ncbi:TetR/AcrR family transcriptional regulator [Herbiconiux moechotypicola]|uniref:TetR family transcriptional regulator n=1 Tax=Herbiconiux moechotypicola TaxID=637393 RepID=A0ABP5QDT9_9MICO|nr:TetR/AcrR family transcriptional regulator [Herbiconiux moechotypicola]MCS5729812.1 TetR/AcrR family transcriptional regulator [Herbiconiux moechotypicola]
MRQNNRVKVLDAAIRVVEAHGVRGLTLEATAEEAGLTRGGMMYHFRDRDALLVALHEHLAQLWEQQLEQAAGKPAAEATPDERIAAYAIVTASDSAPAELALLLEGSKRPEFAGPWEEVQRRWTPTAAEAVADPAAFDRFVLRLAADGLWAYDALTGDTLTPDFRQALARRIAEL